MKKAKLILTSICILLFINQLSSQQWVLLVQNVKNKKEHIIKSGEKVRLDIKNKKGKINEDSEVRILSIDTINLYVEPIKKRYPSQNINIQDLKYIRIKTPGTKIAGCLLFPIGLFSSSGSVGSSSPNFYKKIRFDKGKWGRKIIQKEK